MKLPLPEIEFELTAYQYEMMGFPGLKQGEPVSVVLDAGVLLPDVSAESWFTVQKETLPSQFVRALIVNSGGKSRLLRLRGLALELGGVPLGLALGPQHLAIRGSLLGRVDARGLPDARLGERAPDAVRRLLGAERVDEAAAAERLPARLAGA